MANDVEYRKPFCESCQSKDVTIIDDCDCPVVEIKCNKCGVQADFCKLDFEQDFNVEFDFDDPDLEPARDFFATSSKGKEVLDEMMDTMAEFIPDLKMDEKDKNKMFEDILEMVEKSGKDKEGTTDKKEPDII
jgi:hypothetical protein